MTNAKPIIAQPPRRGQAAYDTIAAVDLGSNSFHMIVTQIREGELHVLDHLREMVRLSSGLDTRGQLSVAAQKRALACLARFGQRLRSLPRGAVRAVGTHTLRQAKNARAFLLTARKALGHPIDVIGGHEEARLIFVGASHGLPPIQGRRLVIDIGGGSTECMLGTGFEATHMESLEIGCVSLTRRFFANGAIAKRNFARAEIAAALEFQNVAPAFRALGWEAAAGASGTVNAVAQILRANGWSSGDITRAGLTELRTALIAARRASRLKLAGLRPERADILAGGAAILMAAFDGLGLNALRPAVGALREGLLYDLLGRIRHEDVRDRTVNALCVRYQVDLDHARRVEGTAQSLLANVAARWDLATDEAKSMLGWAARLHEIGLTIAHSQYHKHGAYLVENSDMAGFSREEQQFLAVLVRGHRRKWPQAALDALPKGLATRAARLVLLLRLAVLLNRSRSPQLLPPLQLKASEASLRLALPRDYLASHPLTAADLGEEVGFLKEAGWRLSVSRR